MARLHQFPSVVAAKSAAAYLLSRGVLARVQESIGPYSLIPDGAWIEVNSESLEAARMMVHEYLKAPIELEVDWEVECLPDLKKLNPKHAPTCPLCGAKLPMDANAEACPQCGARVDVVRLIVEQHGPEALAACTIDEGDVDPIADDVLQTIALVCPACRYSLLGLAIEGACPECGGTYSKRDLIARL